MKIQQKHIQNKNVNSFTFVIPTKGKLSLQRYHRHENQNLFPNKLFSVNETKVSLKMKNAWTHFKSLQQTIVPSRVATIDNISNYIISQMSPVLEY